MSWETRSGIGYDVHPLVAGRRLVLAGVSIEFERGLAGHSDADVVAHAIGDALLGALALGDLGTHYPPDDPQLAGISSLDLLRDVAGRVRERQARVVHVDATVVAERPRLAPHVPAMRRNIAAALGVEVAAVSIKATTHEGLGTLGRGEGMAALAVATVACPAPGDPAV